MKVSSIPQISDEEFYATPEHLRGLDRVVDPLAPDFMASRSAGFTHTHTHTAVCLSVCLTSERPSSVLSWVIFLTTPRMSPSRSRALILQPWTCVSWLRFCCQTRLWSLLSSLAASCHSTHSSLLAARWHTCVSRGHPIVVGACLDRSLSMGWEGEFSSPCGRFVLLR